MTNKSKEIKFRAWFKPLKRMYAVRDMKFQRNGNITILTNNNGGTYPTNYELMQFTSLKDKNGKEIYEGDILFWKDGDDTCNVEVKFEDGCFTDGDGCLNELNLEEKYEVIGNKFKNPELLDALVSGGAE